MHGFACIRHCFATAAPAKCWSVVDFAFNRFVAALSTLETDSKHCSALMPSVVMFQDITVTLVTELPALRQGKTIP